MKSIKKNQSGFSALEIVLLIVIVALLGFLGWYVWHTKQTSNQTTMTSTSTGGPAPGHVVTQSIKLETGVYSPANADIKKGTTVTWEITDTGDIPQYGITSDTNSSEKFSSGVLKSGDKFSHTFNSTGTFGWHDQFNGNLTGTVTVTE